MSRPWLLPGGTLDSTATIRRRLVDGIATPDEQRIAGIVLAEMCAAADRRAPRVPTMTLRLALRRLWTEVR